MRTELVTIPTTTTPLDGAFYEPNGGMLGVRHVADHPRTPALVLLSAGRGGATSMKEGDRKSVV